MQRLELDKATKLFHGVEGEMTFFHIQFCEISERDDAVYTSFAQIEAVVSMRDIADPQESQLLYKRRKRKGMCNSGIDSHTELWDAKETVRLYAVPDG